MGIHQFESQKQKVTNVEAQIIQGPAASTPAKRVARSPVLMFVGTTPHIFW